MRTERGQLLLPMLAVITIFTSFWGGYVLWCRNQYWQMRMDAAAEMTAISAARQQAELLNLIGTQQLALNATLQKAKFVDLEVAHLQVAAYKTFRVQQSLLKASIRSFRVIVLFLAHRIAIANGADSPPVPMGQVNHNLEPRGVWIQKFAKLIPAGLPIYVRDAYFVRRWWPRKTNPQPDHRCRWTVKRRGITGRAYAGLWLDVNPHEYSANGGFPSGIGWGWREQGILCNYPQFNARLLRDR